MKKSSGDNFCCRLAYVFLVFIISPPQKPYNPLQTKEKKSINLYHYNFYKVSLNENIMALRNYQQTEKRSFERAPEVEQNLLIRMLRERGFDVGLKTAEVHYSRKGRRSLLLAESFEMDSDQLGLFVEEYERRVVRT